MYPRVTIRQVAAQAGVHFTTAALALKESQRVHPETRKKVRAVADELGYMPDPMLSSLCAYRQARRESAFHGTLAWVTSDATETAWQHHYRLIYFKAVKERARLHGYNVEEFWRRRPGLTSARASRILLDRGIRGLLICPMPADQGHMNLEWDKFSVVAFGHSMARPLVSIVTTDRFNSVVRCMRRLRAMGYRRIGCVVSDSARFENQQLGAFYVERELLPESAAIPICKITRDQVPRVPPWFHRHRPEALVATEMSVPFFLHQAGIRMPQDVSVMVTGLQDENDYFNGASGVMENSTRMGHAAVDLLVGMLQRGERGIPEAAQRIQIQGTWVEGMTAVPRADRAKVPPWAPFAETKVLVPTAR